MPLRLFPLATDALAPTLVQILCRRGIFWLSEVDLLPNSVAQGVSPASNDLYSSVFGGLLRDAVRQERPGHLGAGRQQNTPQRVMGKALDARNHAGPLGEACSE